jgi:phytoene dehydrogenase-like protein
MSEASDSDVIVVGAGHSGLAATALLASAPARSSPA